MCDQDKSQMTWNHHLDNLFHCECVTFDEADIQKICGNSKQGEVKRYYTDVNTKINKFTVSIYAEKICVLMLRFQAKVDNEKEETKHCK